MATRSHGLTTVVFGAIALDGKWASYSLTYCHSPSVFQRILRKKRRQWHGVAAKLIVALGFVLAG
jgi:hypothetical protein